MKTFILDANIPLHDSNAIYNFGDSEVVIPAIVLEETDSKKREQTEVGRNARQFARNIKKLRKDYEGELSTGVPLENGGTFRIELNHVSFKKMQEAFGEKTNDNRILAVVMNLKEEMEAKLSDTTKKKLELLKKDFIQKKMSGAEYWDAYYELTGRLFTLISNDNLVVAKADTLLLKVEEYDNDRVENLDSVHKGYHEVFVPSALINKFYKEDELNLKEVEGYIKESIGIGENDKLEDFVFMQDFLILKDNEGTKQSGLGRVIRQGNSAKLVKLVLDEIDNEYKEKGIVNPGIYGITPKNVEQRMLLELLMDPNVSLIIAMGPAGTGKTLLALAAALQQTEIDNVYRKTIAARPIIPMGKDIGYLPGDKDEKLRQWMQPIYDNLEFLLGLEKEESTYEDDEGKRRKTVDEKIKHLNIELEALTYMRGRTVPYQLGIFDEAQNMSGFEGKTTITRAGLGAKMILLGDPEQIDHPYLDSTNNALTYVADKMKAEPNVGIIRLSKTERSPLAERAAKLL